MTYGEMYLLISLAALFITLVICLNGVFVFKWHGSCFIAGLFIAFAWPAYIPLVTVVFCAERVGLLD